MAVLTVLRNRASLGPKSCDADRLPADELEDAVLRALVNLYQRTDLWEPPRSTRPSPNRPQPKNSTSCEST
jgi:hypothetical protein